MKVTISITIFLLEIGCIYSDITSEWKGWSETCCEILYKDDKNFQNECVNQLVEDITGTFSENNIDIHLENVEIKAENKLRKELVVLPENVDKLKGLENIEDRKRVRKQIFEENKSQIDAVRKEARTKEVEEIDKTFRNTCEAVSKEVAEINDPNTFTVDVMALIITSEVYSSSPETNEAFIEHLKNNKEDVEKLKELGADLWQKLVYLFKNVFDFMKTCNCKDILLTNNFNKFLKWVTEYKLKNFDSYEFCSLDKYVEIYKKHKDLIDEDPKKNEATITEDVKNCKI